MYFNPDWTQVYPTPQDIERDLPDIKFTGPGFYFTDTDTVLITPLPPDSPPTQDNIWHTEQPADTVWQVHVWNCPFNTTILSVVAVTPVRYDARS